MESPFYLWMFACANEFFVAISLCVLFIDAKI